MTPTFLCGHVREGHNVLWFRNRGNTSSRCRLCHNAMQREKHRLGRRALEVVLDLVRDQTLSEGQASRALQTDRVSLRGLLDERAEQAA